jgi:hypothetical protein
MSEVHAKKRLAMSDEEFLSLLLANQASEAGETGWAVSMLCRLKKSIDNASRWSTILGFAMCFCSLALVTATIVLCILTARLAP